MFILPAYIRAFFILNVIDCCGDATRQRAEEDAVFTTGWAGSAEPEPGPRDTSPDVPRARGECTGPGLGVSPGIQASG